MVGGRVPRPGHEFADRRARLGGQGEPGVTQPVDRKARFADRGAGDYVGIAEARRRHGRASPHRPT